MGTTIPYQPRMRLGRTFDLKTLQMGFNMFTDEALDKLQKTYSQVVSSKYVVVKSTKDINKFLCLDRKISLKVKAGALHADVVGPYLNECRPEKNTVEILLRIHIETVSEAVHESSTQVDQTKNIVGSHYIQSITYGGELLVRIRLRGSSAPQFEDIEQKITGRIMPEGLLNDEIRENFRQLENLGCKIDITSYSRPLQGTIPQNIAGMLKFIDEFTKSVTEEGHSMPLSCELHPLNDPGTPLITFGTDEPQGQQETPTGIKQGERPELKPIEEQLSKLEAEYDDVVQAKSKLGDFFKRRESLSMDDELEMGASEIEDRLDSILTVFNNVIVQLDVSSENDRSPQLTPAFDIYRKNMKCSAYLKEVEDYIESVRPPVQANPLRDLPPGRQLNLILIGKTGHGKSATGNTILGGDFFSAQMSSSSVTSKCEAVTQTVGGRRLCLVDTPGTVTTHAVESHFTLSNPLSLIHDGCSAFLIVINFHARYTREERAAVMMLSGDEILRKYGVLVFTHGNSLYSQQRSEGKMMFYDFIKSRDDALAKLLVKCNKRCVLIDNMEEDQRKCRAQVIELINVIDNLQAQNYGENYTKDMFERERITRGIAEAMEEPATSPKRRPRDPSILVEPGPVDPYRPLDYGCFSGDADIMLENGEFIKMKNLQVGNKVLSSVYNGKLLFSEVYFFSHREDDIVGKFINISAGRYTLKLTREHHVYLVSGRQKYTAPAEDIKIGDHILILNSDNNAFEEQVITKLSTSSHLGVYAPITMSGTIIASNIYASCYVDCVSPRLSHILLWPLRQLHNVSPTLSALINTPQKNGLPVWVQWCMENIILPYRKTLGE